MSSSPKPFMKALNGEAQDTVPFWFMRQAGRYLPEYRDLRAQKNGFLDMAYDPKAACEITMQPIRRFGMDAAIIFSDILVVPHALGQRLDFVEGAGPKLDAIDDPVDLRKLSLESIHSVLEPVYQAIENTASSLKSEGFEKTALIGFAGAPWTVATYMIEGGSSKDFMKTKKMAYSDPKSFENLIDMLVLATTDYLCRQIDAGAEALQVFDSWSGALSADQFERWSVQPAKRIVSGVHDKHPDVPIIGFPKGAGLKYKHYAKETGVSALGLDSQVCTEYAARELQHLLPVQGNLDPAVLYCGGDCLKNAAENIMKNLASGPFVFNLGHGVHKDTPTLHVEELVGYIRDFKP